MPINCRRITSTFAIVAFLLTIVASAELKSVGPAAIDLTLPDGTAGLTVNGKSTYLKAREASDAIVVTAMLDCVTKDGEHTSCIKTGIERRDRHLWNYLESGKFQEATLSVERSKLKMPNDNEKTVGDVTGTLLLHGVKQSLGLHYAAHRTGDEILVQGQVAINLKDFNIQRPTFAGIHTGMIATIRVQFKLRDG